MARIILLRQIETEYNYYVYEIYRVSNEAGKIKLFANYFKLDSLSS